jgi:hypothetical protein
MPPDDAALDALMYLFVLLSDGVTDLVGLGGWGPRVAGGLGATRWQQHTVLQVRNFQLSAKKAVIMARKLDFVTHRAMPSPATATLGYLRLGLAAPANAGLLVQGETTLHTLVDLKSLVHVKGAAPAKARACGLGVGRRALTGTFQPSQEACWDMRAQRLGGCLTFRIYYAAERASLARINHTPPSTVLGRHSVQGTIAAFKVVLQLVGRATR